MNSWQDYPCVLDQTRFYDIELCAGTVIYHIEPIKNPYDTPCSFYSNRHNIISPWQILRVRLTSDPITYMADFTKAYAITSAHEGGYANHIADTGGETMMGITRKNYKDWEGWPIVDSLKAKPGFPGTANTSGELKRLAAQFYKSYYWDVFRLDTVEDQSIANEVFDTAVNMGPGRAANFLQRALNVTNRNGKAAPDVVVDGKVGPATIKALNTHQEPKMVLKVLNILQGEFYVRLAERSPSQEIFMKSWLSRVAL